MPSNLSPLFATLLVPLFTAACGGSSAPAVPSNTSDAAVTDVTSAPVDTGTMPADAGSPIVDAPPDVPVAIDGGPSKCGGSTFRLCDGFESPAIDTSVWSLTLTSNATVAIDSTHVARGARSLHVHTGVNGMDTVGTNGGLRTMHGFPFPGNVLWGRVFVYMAGQSPDMHTNMIEAVGTLPGDAGESHYRIGVSTAHVLAGNYIPGDYADHSATTMPLDRWTCFEWNFDGAKNEYHFYLDGNELTDMAITSGHTPPWTAPPFAYVEMGLHLYHPLTTIPTLDVWYDEIAMDTARVGCAE